MRGRCEANRSTIGSVVAAMAVLLVPSSTQAGVLVVEDAFREAKAGRFVDVRKLNA